MGDIKILFLAIAFPLFANANVEIVYTWSTMMPLSVDGISEVQTICENNQFSCMFIFDPFQPIETLDNELLPYATSQEIPAELIEQGILNHFPGIAVYRDGQLQGNIHLGYLMPDALEMIIKRRLK